MSRTVLALALAAISAACDTTTPAPPPPPPRQTAAPVECCVPSGEPQCCMQIGGVEIEGGCPVLTCDVPSPETPGWELFVDDAGCVEWQVPFAPSMCPPLGPPEDAGRWVADAGGD
jgi:hypothetical protein